MVLCTKCNHKQVIITPKEGDKLTCLFSAASAYYSKANLVITTEDANNPEDRGLIDMPNVKLRIKDINDESLKTINSQTITF